MIFEKKKIEKISTLHCLQQCCNYYQVAGLQISCDRKQNNLNRVSDRVFDQELIPNQLSFLQYSVQQLQQLPHSLNYLRRNVPGSSPQMALVTGMYPVSVHHSRPAEVGTAQASLLRNSSQTGSTILRACLLLSCVTYFVFARRTLSAEGTSEK